MAMIEPLSTLSRAGARRPPAMTTRLRDPWDSALPPEEASGRVANLRGTLERFGAEGPRYPSHWPANIVEQEFAVWLWRRWERGTLPEGLMASLNRDRSSVAHHEAAHVAVAEELGLDVEGSAIIHSIPRPIGVTKLVSRPERDIAKDYSIGRLSGDLRARLVVTWAGMLVVPELGAKLDGGKLRFMRGVFGCNAVDRLESRARDLLRSHDVKQRWATAEAALIGSGQLEAGDLVEV